MSIHLQPYRIVPRYGVTLPMCALQLLGRAGRVTVHALVDTGARYSVFPLKAAEDAEIDLPSVPNQTIEFGYGQVGGFRKRVYIVLHGRRLEMDMVFVERLSAPFAILGRLGVFNRHVEIAFVEGGPHKHIRFNW